MLALILLPLAAAAAATPPPPSPPSRASRPIAVDDDGTPIRGVLRTRIAVTLRAPEGVLWSGPLWVSPRGQTSWRLTVSEPADPTCTPSYGYGGEGNELSITLQALNNGTWDGEQLFINVRWARRGDEPCAGLRGVDLRDTIRLPAGGTAQLRGDGGLVVDLRRE